jgi:hypothetical protein
MTDSEKHRTVRGVDEISLNLRRVYDADRATLIWSSLSSAYDRLLFAHHHLKLLRKVAKPAVEQGLGTFGCLVSLDNEEDTEALFSQSMHQIKMHVTDCIQHLHAIGDTVAFAIYFLIEIPEDKQLSRRDITLSALHRLLERNPVLPATAVFLALLKDLAINENYVYLVDLNNHAKHRSIVKPSVSIPFDREVSEEDHEDLLIFSTVEMSNPPPSLQNRSATPVHRQRPILSFIESELVRIWDIYGELRQEIEKQLRSAPSRAAYAAARET